jgi:hypothetical protein
VPSALAGKEFAEMRRERTRVVVDGLLFNWQAHGGLSRLFSETLPRMCDQDASLSVELLVSGPPLQPLPAHGRIRARRVPRLTRPAPAKGLRGASSELVGRFLRDLSFGRGFGKIWHSTYNTLPGHWRGAEVVTVADTIYELFPTLFSRPEDDAFRAQRRKCLERADAIICISHATRADVSRTSRHARTSSTSPVRRSSNHSRPNLRRFRRVSIGPSCSSSVDGGATRTSICC